MTRDHTVWMFTFFWLAAVVAGFRSWERYDTTPGPTGESASAVVPGPGRWCVTVFAHPHCPCTRGTIRELDALARAAPEVSIRILFVRPPTASEGWERGGSWETASGIPGATVSCDENGTEAEQLGAKTSGHAVLTDPIGRVAFRGGLSAGRSGGPGAGRIAILDRVRGRDAPTEAPVFGCSLFTPAD